ncbi:hypothetical protein HDZ31DRAFT_84287 [Schizophyllum fasciatum]
MLIVDDNVKQLPDVQPDVTVMHAHTVSDGKQAPPDGDDEALPPPYTAVADDAPIPHTHPSHTNPAPVPAPAPAFASGPPPASASSPSSSSSLPPSKFVSITRQNQAIKGAWAVDPSLPSILQQAPGDPDVHMQSTNGRIEAEVTVLAHAPADAAQRTRMNLKTTNGAVTLVVHTPDRFARTPLKLWVRSTNGGITLVLPRSFVGSLNAATTNSRVQLSEGVLRAARDVQEGPRETKCMIGLGTGSGKDGQALDMADVGTTNGSVRVRFENEEMPVEKGLLAKWFGL